MTKKNLLSAETIPELIELLNETLQLNLPGSFSENTPVSQFINQLITANVEVSPGQDEGTLYTITTSAAESTLVPFTVQTSEQSLRIKLRLKVVDSSARR